MEPLKQAKVLVDRIHKMTRDIALSGKKDEAEQEAEAFTVLMDVREPLIEELTDLRLQITKDEAKSAEFEAIRQTIAQITELDKKKPGNHGGLSRQRESILQRGKARAKDSRGVQRPVRRGFKHDKYKAIDLMQEA